MSENNEEVLDLPHNAQKKSGWKAAVRLILLTGLSVSARPAAADHSG